MLLKVIGSDTDRSATYDFLITFHRNHGHISYCFQQKMAVSVDNRKFFPPRACITLPLREFPLKLDNGAWAEKNGWRFLSEKEV